MRGTLNHQKTHLIQSRIVLAFGDGDETLLWICFYMCMSYFDLEQVSSRRLLLCSAVPTASQKRVYAFTGRKQQVHLFASPNGQQGFVSYGLAVAVKASDPSLACLVFGGSSTWAAAFWWERTVLISHPGANS